MLLASDLVNANSYPPRSPLTKIMLALNALYIFFTFTFTTGKNNFLQGINSVFLRKKKGKKQWISTYPMHWVNVFYRNDNWKKWGFTAPATSWGYSSTRPWIIKVQLVLGRDRETYWTPTKAVQSMFLVIRITCSSRFVSSYFWLIKYHNIIFSTVASRSC